MSHQYLSRIENLLRPEGNVLLNMTYDEAAARVLSGDPKQVDKIDGQFAIMVSEGKTVRMARSIGRPLRYFLAKLIDGPCLLVAERMDEIVARLKEMGISGDKNPGPFNLKTDALPFELPAPAPGKFLLSNLKI